MWERIGKNAGWSLVSIAAVALFGFGAMYFNTRALGVEGMGVLASVLALSLMLEALAGLQCWQAVLALGEGREQRIFGAALAINLVTAGIGAMIGLIVLHWLGTELDRAAFWAAVTLIASQLFRVSDPLTGILRKFDRFGFIAIVRALTGFATFLMAIWFWSIGAPLAHYLIGFSVIYLANIAVLVFASFRLCPPKCPNLSETKEVLSFSVPTGLSGAVGAIRQRGLLVLLGAIAGANAAGIYAVADRIASLLQMLYRAMFEAVFREMPSAKNRKTIVMGLAGAGLLFAALAILLVHTLGPWLIDLVAGLEFIPAAQVLTVLIAAICLSIITLGLRAWVIVAIGPGSMLWCNLFALLGIFAAPVLISEYGALGAAWVQIIFECLWLVAVLVLMAWFRWSGSRPAPTQGQSAED